MAIDVVDLLTKIGIPIIAAASGWIGAAVKLAGRLSAIETHIATHIGIDHAQIAATYKQDVNDIRADMLEKIAECREEIEHLEQVTDKFRASATDYAKDARLAEFIVDQHKKWESINRTLGLIEGAIQRFPMVRK